MNFPAHVQWPTLPKSTMVVLFVVASATWCALELLRVFDLPQYLAASVPGAAMPALVRHFRRVAYYNRIAHLMEREARRELRTCALCNRVPVITTHTHGMVADAHITCRCGVALELSCKSHNVTLPFQMRVAVLEKAMQQWNSDSYRAALTKAKQKAIEA